MKHAARRSATAGFSLVELMVVISIIGLLSTIVTVAVVKQREKATIAKVYTDVKQLDHAIALFHLDTGTYPQALQDLVHPGVSDWHGPYVEGGEKALLDPWKRPYVYQASGGSEEWPYTIGSYGADGVPGGVGESRDIFPHTEP
jgi:general secretion pathway protein G